MVELAMQGARTSFDSIVPDQTRKVSAVELFCPKGQTSAIVVAVNRSCLAKQTRVFFLAQVRRHGSACCGEFHPIICLAGAAEIVSRAVLRRLRQVTCAQ